MIRVTVDSRWTKVCSLLFWPTVYFTTYMRRYLRWVWWAVRRVLVAVVSLLPVSNRLPSDQAPSAECGPVSTRGSVYTQSTRQSVSRTNYLTQTTTTPSSNLSFSNVQLATSISHRFGPRMLWKVLYPRPFLIATQAVNSVNHYWRRFSFTETAALVTFVWRRRLQAHFTSLSYSTLSRS